ncbi:ovarian cancer-associated protein 2 [Aspergillus tubingensis]|uniref:alpha/beta hydrolase n=1 Tax=Aspergillus tubingensis TaxID=5068 RepID=UPI001578F93A|nr:dihydrofolate reductase [Aspergillus tubingensis]GFN10681.1 dihydrofolate reductase [Aspergillus tubingensis]GLA78520.1 ovarian cancer-associated protein 2 [Aspergillus tubingensis]GLB22541.1 ovarian cancer-associated protein 2 [Aspergillus tubingensis]
MTRITTSKLKILMIHGTILTLSTDVIATTDHKLRSIGYTETGESFRADIRGLEKALMEAFPAAPAPGYHPDYPDGVELVYPDGTWRLKPTDWERYIPGTDPGFGWFYKVNDDDEFPGLLDGLQKLGDIMRSQGPFAGVIGFSQGGFLTGLITSLLEPGRKSVFEKTEVESGGIPFPKSFDGVDPIKFSISCCGFAGLNLRYKAFYSPKISGPMLHMNGQFDDVVYYKRSRTLIDATTGAEEEKVLIHPGGHSVPTSKLYTDAMIMFIKGKLAS